MDILLPPHRVGDMVETLGVASREVWRSSVTLVDGIIFRCQVVHFHLALVDWLGLCKWCGM